MAITPGPWILGIIALLIVFLCVLAAIWNFKKYSSSKMARYIVNGIIFIIVALNAFFASFIFFAP